MGHRDLRRPIGGCPQKPHCQNSDSEKRVMETCVCGQSVFGMHANPLEGHILASFEPFYCRAKNTQKRQFEAILTPKLHGTLKKGLHGPRSVHQCLQKGGKGKGGSHVATVPGKIFLGWGRI